jgi:hypothetical protein
VVFQTRLVTIELRDSKGNLIPNSGASVVWRPYGSSTFVPFGSGQLDATGQVWMEVLPLLHQFRVTYLGATEQQTDDDPLMVFWASAFM